MKPRIITGETLAAFQRHLQEAERRPATVAKYLREIQAFAGSLRPGQLVTKETVLAWKEALAQRCAPSTVRSWISRERAVWIRVSLSTSREAVASSKRRMGAFFKKALAMDTRCRSPPESWLPFSPIRVCQPSGSFSANSSQLASRAAARTSSSVASFRPMRMF